VIFPQSHLSTNQRGGTLLLIQLCNTSAIYLHSLTKNPLTLQHVKNPTDLRRPSVLSLCVLSLAWSSNGKSRDSSVGIALGYGLDDRGSRVRFPAGTGDFSLHHRVQNGSGAHPASYPMGNRGFSPGGNAAGV
jgi:hypothetical protein